MEYVEYPEHGEGHSLSKRYTVWCIYNHVHNMRLFDSEANFPFTTSETKRNYE